MTITLTTSQIDISGAVAAIFATRWNLATNLAPITLWNKYTYQNTTWCYLMVLYFILYEHLVNEVLDTVN